MNTELPVTNRQFLIILLTKNSASSPLPKLWREVPLMTSDNKQEYTIHIFGQDITSQDGLFRLDEIRRVGIQIGKVEDNRSTEVARFMRTKVGKSLTNPENGFVKKINMGHLGTSWLADAVAA